MDDFILRAGLAGIGVAIIAGPLGAFVVWRRMAFFGETLAHAALLGIALGLVTGLNSYIGIIITCVALALLLPVRNQPGQLGQDTILGILSHSALSLGLVAMAWLSVPGGQLTAILFGDILSVTRTDIIWIFIVSSTALIILWRIWRPLLAVSVHEELAQVEGVPVVRVRLAFILLLALVIATAMKVVGILLITSLLIIPAAAARRISHSPEQMVVFAALIGCLAVAGGLGASLTWDTPTGPSMVLVAALLFLLGNAIRRV